MPRRTRRGSMRRRGRRDPTGGGSTIESGVRAWRAMFLATNRSGPAPLRLRLRRSPGGGHDPGQFPPATAKESSLRYHPAMKETPLDFARVRELSPRRNTTRSAAIPELVDEQLRHFSIDPQSEFGRRMADF